MVDAQRVGLTPLAVSEVSKAWLKEQGMTQALLYYWDHIEAYHNNAPSPREVQMEQLLEAYWFGEKTALQLYRLAQGWQAIWCTETMDMEYVDERQFIQRVADFGEALHIRSYIEPDEDGQNHIVYTRPLRLVAKSGRLPGGGASYD